MRILIYVQLFIILLFVNGCKKNIDESTPKTKWKVLPFSENYSGFSKIFFVDSLNGCLIGVYDNLNFKNINCITSDGGRTWNFPPLEILNSVAGFRNVCKTTNDILFASGFTKSKEDPLKSVNSFFKSYNKGLSWNAVKENYIPTDGSFVLYALDESNIVATSGYGIHKTEDGGISWNITFSYKDADEAFDKIYFVNLKVGFIGGGFYEDDSNLGLSVFNYGSIAKTVDGGKTWEKLGTKFKKISSIYFLNELTGFVSTMFKPQLLKTIDGGKSWNEINSDLPITPVKTVFFTENKGIIIGNQENTNNCRIYTTVDGGKTWNNEFSSDNVIINDVSVVDEKHIYILAVQMQTKTSKQTTLLIRN